MNTNMINQHPISEYHDQINDQFGSVQKSYNAASDPVQFVQESRSTPFLRYKRKRSLSGHKRSINEKAARSGENRRYGGIKLLVFVLALGICFFETLLNFLPIIQICSYLCALCYFFALDPLGALYRTVAPQSRMILAIITAMAIIGIVSQYPEYIIIAALLSMAGLLAIWKCNASWLAADNWLMSEYVQRAIRASCVDTARIDEVWQTFGRRECSTLLYEMGYEVTELDRIHRAVWLTGWMRGYEKTSKYQQRLQTAEELKANYKHLKDEFTALQKKDIESEKQIRELESQITESENQYMHMQMLYSQIKRENDQLMAANEELLEAIRQPEQTDQDSFIEPSKIIHLQNRLEDITEKTREEKVMEALAAGMSLAEAGKYAGCSKSTAYNIKKSMNL